MVFHGPDVYFFGWASGVWMVNMDFVIYVSHGAIYRFETSYTDGNRL